MKTLPIIAAVVALVVASLSCGGAGRTPEETNGVRFAFWTPTPPASPAPIMIEVPAEPKVIEIIVTPTPEPPEPPAEVVRWCVSAVEAVYMRPSPSTDNYPITELPNGVELIDLGGRSGNWGFFQYEDKSGWVNLNFVAQC